MAKSKFTAKKPKKAKKPRKSASATSGQKSQAWRAYTGTGSSAQIPD